MVERPIDRRIRVPWGRKAILSKNPTFFFKANHSEEWHQSINATAGVLHPSDQKFPYGFLRNHTETYLKKKGKTKQVDIDIRLALLITSHDARDTAVAAAAHAITAKSLRALLHADLNIMHGSYWGLKTWLQCLIAANDGNAASVTDLEALWARKLLPFATQGPRAAEWYLVGVCRTLREMAIPNMDIIPEFAMVMRRAIIDYAIKLEGLRLRNDWAAAHESVLWMIELAKTSPASNSSGCILPEHILDSQFPAWRIWTRWDPDLGRIKLLAGGDCDKIAVVSDLIALEGPDMITGKARTLRDGLIVQYNGAKGLLRWRGIVVEVPDRTRESLGVILGRVAQLVELSTTAGPGHVNRFELFQYFTTSKPITTINLEVFEATCKIPYIPEIDIYNAVREVLDNQDQLAGQHTLAIQNLIRGLDDDRASALRGRFLQDWLRLGIKNCVKECQDAVRTHINEGSTWTKLALEYHVFCKVIRASERHWPKDYQIMKILPEWPSSDDLATVIEIHDALQAQQQERPTKATTSKENAHDVPKITSEVSVPSYLLGEEESGAHPLRKHAEAYCIDRLLGQEAMSESAKCTTEAMMHVWKNTAKPHVNTERRDLAIAVSRSTAKDSALCCRCLTNIAFVILPANSVTNLLSILRKPESELSEAIIALINLLTAPGESWAQCWKDLLYAWLERQAQPGVFKGEHALQYSLRTMNVAEWLSFMRRVEVLLGDRYGFAPNHTPTPPLLHPELLDWKTKLTNYTGTLMRVEAVIGEGSDAIRSLLTCPARAKSLIAIVECLHKGRDTPVELLMQKVVGKISATAYKEVDIQDCLLNLAIATPEAVEICYRVWNAKHDGLEILGLPEVASKAQSQVSQKQVIPRKAVSSGATVFLRAHGGTQSPLTSPKAPPKRAVPLSVVEVMVAGWICSDEISETDKTAIASVAGILGIHAEPFSTTAWNSKLAEAMQFWEGLEVEILAEATRLESLAKSLKARDPNGTTILLQELGIPSNTLLDDEMDNLPPGLIDVVERLGDNEVEVSFPLNALTRLQRGAMGVPEGATSFLLRFCFPATDGMPYAFCTHFSNDKDIDTIEHEYWQCLRESKSPRENICKTTTTAFTWHFQHIIHTQLRAGEVKIADIHKSVKTGMERLGRSCVACDTSHLAARKAQIRRSVPCNLLACARLWYDLPLDVRIPEIRTDIYTVDLMLMSVHAAAMSGRTELLPACPIRNTETIKAILKSLPSLLLISHAVNISAVLKSYHKDAEILISWACVHHRGYIATATGLCKIPTMPEGTHQFVLSNASPRIESDFVSKLPKANTKTTVLFHGTTLDRLPAILAQGLRVCSGTLLQRTGTAHGNGIYLAEEPAMSLKYSSPTTSWRNSGLANMRLLLGCEVIVGVGKIVPSGIHVVTDEKSVIVRYAFLLKSGVSTPIANHIVSAMASGMSALRSGTV